MRFARFLLSPLCLIPLGARYAWLPEHHAPTLIAVTAVGVSPNNVVGGTSVTLSVMLDANAPFGGSTVNLSYSTASVFKTAPKSVAVPQGQKLASIAVVTKPTANTTPVTISATLGSSSAQTTLTVRQPQVATMSVSPTSTIGGGGVVLGLTLDGPAPSGGIAPHVTFTPANLGQLPKVKNCNILNCNGFRDQDTTIAADSTRLTLLVRGIPVRDPQTLDISASLGVPRSASVQITPPPVSIDFRFGCADGASTTSVVGPSTLGIQVSTSYPVSTSGAYVGLTSSPPIGLPSTLELSQAISSTSFNPTPIINPNLQIPIVPADGFFSTSESHFGCVDVQIPQVTQNVSVSVTARSGTAAYSKTLKVIPLALSALTLGAHQIASGQATSFGVRLNGVAGTGGAVVQLSSSDKSVANIPPSVTVPGGLAIASVPFTPVFPSGAPGSVASAIITASYGGQSRSDTVFVQRH